MFKVLDWMMRLSKKLDAQLWKNLETMEKGMQQGQVRVLARLLSHRFGEVPAWVTLRLNIASVDELEAWAEAVLTADSIDAVLKAARH